MIPPHGSKQIVAGLGDGFLGVNPNQLIARWSHSIGCRREVPDHVIPLNEQHLRRLVRDYVAYFQEDRIHDSLDKDKPNRRPAEMQPCAETKVISSPPAPSFFCGSDLVLTTHSQNGNPG